MSGRDEFLVLLGIDGLGAEPGQESVRALIQAVKRADATSVDFLTLSDPLGHTSAATNRLAAAEALAFAARHTERVGLIATAASHYAEPFHTAKAVATLDFISSGRAGVIIDATQSAAVDARFPELDPLTPEQLIDQAAEFTLVVRELWDSWEDGAEIREISTGRYVDNSKIHHIDHSGEYFTVKGPLITPRPPQGQPPVVVRVTATESDVAAVSSGAAPAVSSLSAELTGSLRLARSVTADVVILEVPTAPDAALVGIVRAELARDRAATDSAASEPTLIVRLDTADPAVAVSRASVLRAIPGIDGVEFGGLPERIPAVLDALEAAAVTETGDHRAASSAHSVRTIRDRLHLARPVSRYVN